MNTSSFLSSSLKPALLQSQHLQTRLGRDVTDVYSTPTMEGVYISPEPVKMGGLGEVTIQTPAALNTHLDMDIRTMVPMLNTMKKDKGFEDTYLRVELPDAEGRQAEVKVLQKVDRTNNTIVYALANEKFFGQYNDVYFKKDPKNPTAKEPSAEYKQLMIDSLSMFNRASAALLPKLDELSYQHMQYKVPEGQDFFGFMRQLLPKEVETQKRNQSNSSLMQLGNPPKTEDSKPAKSGLPESPFIPFHGKADVVIANDWQTGKVFGQLPGTYDPLKLFMIHNVYDYGFAPRDASKLLLKGTPSDSDCFSPLREGMENADGVIANKNFVETLVKTNLMDTINGSKAQDLLKANMAQNTLYDMHHGVGGDYNPMSSPFLKAEEGFVKLQTTGTTVGPSGQTVPVATPEAFTAFKQQNKLAMQKKLGLNADPNAIVFCWFNRYDPYQKGVNLFTSNAEALLKKYPQVQLIMCGGDADPRTKQQLDKIIANPDFKDRVVIKDKFVPQAEAVPAIAGSDFILMPSLYEPYGLSQLEAMQMGTIPVGCAVDGLRSTLSDPKVNGSGSFYTDREKAWDYKQTAILNIPEDPIGYRSLLAKQNLAGDNALKHGSMGSKIDYVAAKLGLYKPQLAAYEKGFMPTLERAISLTSQPEEMNQVRINGFNYVNNEHNWASIAERYKGLLTSAYQNKFHHLPEKPTIAQPQGDAGKQWLQEHTKALATANT